MTSHDTPVSSNAGGFIVPPAAPAPPSSESPPVQFSSLLASSSTTRPSQLPEQRSHPLRPGSMKETEVINYIDQSILGVNRRHAKKFSKSMYGGGADEDGGGNRNQGEGQDMSESTDGGYESFKEVVRDIERLVDLVWVTGTPSLQIPYVISLAVLTNSYLSDFPFNPTPTFTLLKKLDYVFASLILGQDADTEVPLSGFETRAARNVVTMTEKVRIKSIAETGRVVVVEVLERGDRDGEEDGEDGEDGVPGAEPGRWEMEAARVYQRTIQLLGDELGQQGELYSSSSSNQVI